MSDVDPEELQIIRARQAQGRPYEGTLMRYQCQKAMRKAQAQYEAFRQ